jgi:molecular chaperone GrpE
MLAFFCENDKIRIMTEEKITKDDNDEEIILEEEGEGLQDKLKKLREKLKKCEAEKQEYLSGWQRAKADFINARKEEEESRKEFMKYCGMKLAVEFLEIADSFDRLMADKENWQRIEENWRKGMENIYIQLMDILKNESIEPTESIGHRFNPEEHESVGEAEVDKEENDNIIMEVIRRGYKINNKILRPDQVRVGKYKISNK